MIPPGSSSPLQARRAEAKHRVVDMAAAHEPVAPEPGGAPPLGALPAARRDLAAVLPGDLERAPEPRFELVVGRLEGEHEDRARPVAGPGDQGLFVVEQATVGRPEPGLGDGPGSMPGILE